MNSAFKILALGLFLLGQSYLAHAQALKLNPQGLNTPELSQARALLSNIESLLPIKIRGRIQDFPVSIAFQDLGKTLGAYHQWNSQILIHKKLLSLDTSDSLLSKKTLIHEIAHHYDNAHFKTVDARHPRSGNPIQRTLRSPISESVWYKNAIGLPSTGLIINTRGVPEKVDRRSPDPYEWKSPAESLAVNLEYFLLDESYKCNRPFQYRLYRKMLAHNPYPGKTCERKDKAFVLNNALLGASPLVDIDVDRLYGLHYFFAGEGKAAMSRFGHAMLRLVVCKPGREKGPDCVKDVGHHLVLSYAALLDDGQISTLKGLKGDYAAVLNVSPLTHMVQKYNEGELREILSYPIPMEEERLKALADLIQERHWNYSGSYKFLSNNCADETLGFLKSLFYDVPELASENISRPDTLRDLLASKRFISTKELENKESAALKGYYFPSQRARYQKALDHLYRQGILLDPIAVEDYFQTSFKKRSEAMELAIQSGELDTLSYAILLERVIYKKNQANELEKWKKSTLKQNQSMEKSSVLDSENFNFLVPPIMMLEPSFGQTYGIPSAKEILELEKAIEKTLNANGQKAQKQKETSNKALKNMKDQVDLLARALKALLQLRN